MKRILIVLLASVAITASGGCGFMDLSLSSGSDGGGSDGGGSDGGGSDSGGSSGGGSGGGGSA